MTSSVQIEDEQSGEINLPSKENVVEGLMHGIPVSEGIAIGRVWILESPWDEVIAFPLKRGKLKREVNRYREAVEESAQQLIECRDLVQKDIGEDEAKIFEAHLAILGDSFFQRELVEAIRDRKQNAEFLLKEGIEERIEAFLKMENEYLRFRADDIKDVAVRILRVLLRTEEVKWPARDPAILVSHSLTPSDTARIDREKVLGFATELGGQTSHASILARSMGLPAVVGVEKLLKRAANGDTIIVDGNLGIVHVRPPEHIVKGYEKRQKQFNSYWKRLSEEVALPAVTTDGTNISLQANIAMTPDVSLASRYHAEGIGLFRTELPFLNAGRLLTEEEQFTIYRTIVEAMPEKEVTIRTLDLGGDKFLPFQDVETERNPFLGWRSIRIFLQERDVFKTQLRAILRASQFGRVRILFPMISNLGEILEIKNILEETREELRQKGNDLSTHIPIGIMIEVPSAAILAERFAKHIDFFSIGTNDLIQYTLAVDRNNERVAEFYQPLNPAILELVRMTIKAGQDAGIDVSLCGEMAGNPLYTAMLLGFGLRHFSMSPVMLPEVKERIRALSMTECEEIAADIITKDSAPEIADILWTFHHKINKKQSIPLMDRGEAIQV